MIAKVQTPKSFPKLSEVVDVMTRLAVVELRGAITSYEDERKLRWFRLEGDAVTTAGGWPRTWWQSFKDMLNQNRFSVSADISSGLPVNVVLDLVSSRFAWFVVVDERTLS